MICPDGEVQEDAGKGYWYALGRERIAPGCYLFPNTSRYWVTGPGFSLSHALTHDEQSHSRNHIAHFPVSLPKRNCRIA
jgi:hypothetical protein